MPMVVKFYVDDIVEGEAYCYFTNSGSGILHSKWTYVNGLEQGTKYEYFENGKIKKEIGMVDGEMNGKYNEYFENGQLKIKANKITKLIDGSYSCEWDGEYIEYNIYGDKIHTYVYKNGEIVK
jgi:antitoxin component YwqK of YwqJK toxin-antitoxin module